MSVIGPESVGAEDRGPSEVESSAAVEGRPSPRPSTVPLIAAGIVAGLLAFAGGEAATWIIPAETVVFKAAGVTGSIDTRDTPKVVIRTLAIAFGSLGLCVGAGFGIAGGLSRRPAAAGSTTIAAGVGAVLGAGLGVAIAFGLVPLALATRAGLSDPPMWYGMVHHVAATAPLGLIAGLAFAIGSGDRRMIVRAALAGLGGAIAGSVAFDVLGAIAFPLARTDAPLAETWPARLAARLLAALGIAIAIAATPRPDAPPSA